MPSPHRGGGTRAEQVKVGFVDRSPEADGGAGPQFLAALAAVSGGAWDADPAPRPGRTATEVLDEVRSGALHLAWLRTDALEAAGFSGLAVLQAPFLVVTPAAQEAVTRDGVAGALLAPMEQSGVIGIALWGGPLRRPIAAHAPLLDLDSWTGRRIRSHSPTQSAAFAAWGSIPVEVAGDLAQLVPVGTVDGAETDLPRQRVAADITIAPYVTADIVLWSRFSVVVANPEWLAGLTEPEHGWLRMAAEQARRASFPSAPSDDAAASALCAVGARFPRAGSAAAERLREAVAPMLERFRDDPRSAAVLAAIEAAPAVAPQPPPGLTVPSWCTGSVSPLREVSAVPGTTPPVPPGTYRLHLTAEDIASAGVGKVQDAQVVTLVISRDGEYTSTSRFDDDGSVMVFEAGDIRGDLRTLYFVNDLAKLQALQAEGIDACVWTDPGLGCITNTAPYSVTWSLGPDGSLRLSDPVGVNPDPVLVLTFVAHPYQRVGR